MPTSGSVSSRGSSTSTASTWCRAVSRRSGSSQVSGVSRKSDTTTTRPRRRTTRPSCSAATPSSGSATPGGVRGSANAACSSAIRCGRPVLAGSVLTPPPCSRWAPMRLPVRWVRKPTEARADRASSRFSIAAVPKSMLAVASSSAQISSSRSATRSRTCGSFVRAVTFQSIRRTSSPAVYGRDSAGSLPGPGTRPRCSPWSSPSSLLVMVSSSLRSAGSAIRYGFMPPRPDARRTPGSPGSAR